MDVGGGRQISLATRIGWAFIFLTAVTLSTVGGVLIFASRQAQEQSIFVGQEKAAHEVILVISSYVNNALDDLRLFGKTWPLATMSESDAKRILENLLAVRPAQLSGLALLDAGGQEKIKVSHYHAFLSSELENRAESDLYVRAMVGQPFVGPISISSGSGLLSMEIAVPLQTPEGIDGVLVAEVNVTSLWQEVSRVEIGQTGYAYLVDTQGRFVAHQEPAQVLQRYGEDMSRIPPVAAFVVGQSDDAHRAYKYVGLTGERVVGLLQPIEDTDWAVVVELPTQEAYASVTRMQWYLMGLILLGLVVAGGLGFVIPSRLARPIRALTVSAQRIGAGDLDAEIVELRRRDEVGVLARAFRQMQGQLKALYEGLEQRVADRTRELAATAEDLATRGQELESALAELQKRETELEEAVRLQQEARRRQEEINRELQAANEATRRRSAQLQATAEVSRAIAQVRDPDELLPQVTQLISRFFDFYHVGIFLIDEVGRDAVLRAANSEGGGRMLARGHRLQVGEQGIVGYVTGTGQPRIALDVGADAVYFDNPDLPETRSEVALPLRRGDEIIGALDVQSTEPGAFDDQDVAVLQALAGQVSIALENARLFAQTQAALAEAEAVHQQYLLQEWRRYAQQATDLSHEYLLGGRESLASEPLPAGEAALEKGSTVILSADDSDQAAALAVPIKLRDQVIGVLDLQETDQNRRWSEEEIALTEAVAEQLALALESARLFEQTQSRARRETLTRQITERIRNAMDVDAMLQTAVQELGQALGAPRVYVRLATEASGDAEEGSEVPAVMTIPTGPSGSDAGQGDE